MEWIDYRELPPSAGGFSQLFFDYVHAYEEVRQFYPRNFRDRAAFDEVMQQIDSHPPNRATLVRVLEEQNHEFGATEKSLEHIALLGKSTTYAVVTGQQVGLFGGPLYTIFKTITAIKLAERLKAKYPSNEFVPVFWLEGEDHDFEEMNNIALMDAENQLKTIEYLPGGTMPEHNMGAIGELAFDDAFQNTSAQLEAALQQTEFTAQVLDMLFDAYKSGVTFNRAFATWMGLLFQDYGLVFLSSNHRDFKQLLSPLFVKEISEFPKTSQLVIDRSADLEKQYHAQVKPKSLNLFLFHKGGRFLIQPRETDFSLKGTRHFIGREELLSLARTTPELLSPNVVLRPLAQDTLLPTIAYIAGPSEVAYHAQLSVLYDHFAIAQPVIYPRASASFVDERLTRAMEKYQLTMTEFLEDKDTVTAKVVEQIASVKLDAIFGHAVNATHETLNELKFGLKEIDPTLLGALEGIRSKTDSNLNVLKGKAMAAQKRKNEAAVRQLEKAHESLLPNGSLQERELNILYYMNKYGPDLVPWIMGELDISGFKHQLLEI